MTICVKTPKGIEEIAHRSNGMPLTERRLLIMVDGSRDFSALASMFPADDALAMLEHLLDNGYIKQRIVEKPKADSPPKPEIDAAKRYEMARNFMLNTTSAFLGVFGSGLQEKIEAATCLADLQALFKPWREAILLTPEGKRQAYELEHRLASLLS